MEELWIKALNGIVDIIQNWLDKAPDYVVNLVDRYSAYQTYTSWCLTLFWFIFLIASIALFAYWKSKEYDDGDIEMILGWLWVIVWIVMVMIFVSYLFKWIYIPEVLLLNEFNWCR